MNFSKATSVQFSIFTLDDELQAEPLFREAFGGAPDETQTNRSPSPQKNFLSIASSTTEDMVSIVRVSSGRIDFQFAAPEKTVGKPIFTSFDAADALERMLSCVAQVNFHEKHFIRLAVNVSLTMPQGSSDEARDVFYALTELPQVAPDMQDLLIQVNNRRSLDGQIKINRLVQYMTTLVQVGQFQIYNIGMNPTTIVELHSATVQLDFNTVPGDILITSEGVIELFLELSEDVQHAIKHPSLKEIYRG